MERSGLKGYTIDEINIGDTASFMKTISESDVYLFAGITGDNNPAHINQIEAEKGAFKGRIAHGILTAGLVSAVLGMRLPGPGTIYMGQELKFTKPVYFGDTITAKVTVEEKIKNKIVKLHTQCTNQQGEIVLDGYATVLPPKK
ncbi:MaoC family dehydratase [Peptoniphilus equinus]|uniref:MaoC family dehydratase n=1 Tax=Peptoniphilus equinus TaxID=3016343 RepID=A0ABY7QU14_9FIRM|nr:MaoC family dehydratase [Peptoniphilus equinus]WBW50272.1 MaoC family dehydratase [Peptoniphilus equinus]